jgi:DNA-binding HxlR family transcriptional regulator
MRVGPVPAWSDLGESVCPVARSQGNVGDRWTILVLRELFFGNHRFDDILMQSQTTPQLLTARLKKLEADGLVERRLYNERPKRFEYMLTAKGQAFYPVIRALRAWGEEWCKGEDEPLAVQYVHGPCGKDPGLGPVCQSCGIVVRRQDLTSRLGEAFAEERDARRRAFKANPI